MLLRVLYCVQNNCYLADLPLEKFREYSSTFDDDIYQALKVEHAVEARKVVGGTAKKAVEEQLRFVHTQINSTQEWLHAHPNLWNEPHPDFLW